MPIAFTLLFSVFSAAAPILPALKTQAVTVSGVSSGAFLAVQLQVATSEKIEGVGIVAGGIYGCTGGKPAKALEWMQRPEKVNVESHIAEAREASAKGLIDPAENLARARIHLFHSEADKVVKVAAAAKLKEFFLAFTPPQNIRETFSEIAAHGFPTLNYGNECSRQGAPWLQNCGEDGAGAILQHLYPGISEPAGIEKGQLLSFDQTIYAEPEAGLLNEGKLFVPDTCASGSGCRLHVALHGCQMSTVYVGNDFVESAGYNRWAAANRIVVLYPQVGKSAKNPNGCWDWFGYTGPDYALKSGKQMRAIHQMMDALAI